MEAFESVNIGKVLCKNRFVRSATFEGAGDSDGFPTKEYFRILEELAKGGVGTIITGFTYFRGDGKALEPGQVGIDSDDKIDIYKRLTKLITSYDVNIFIQLAHTGRQTTREATGTQVRGVGSKKSFYFNSRVKEYSTGELDTLLEDFAQAALRSKRAGFTGIQLHLAHGYLLHQFFSPLLNRREDKYGDSFYFLKKLLIRIRELCGDYPIWVKVSADDSFREFKYDLKKLVLILNKFNIDLIEVSYGSMEMPFNIFRGKTIPYETILDYNPRFKSRNPVIRWILKNVLFSIIKCTIFPYSDCYNLESASKIEVINSGATGVVGGIGNLESVKKVLDRGIQMVFISRPLIKEPGLITRWMSGTLYNSSCTYCNRCAVMADSSESLKCF